MDRPHQRIGSPSNAHVGASFEAEALAHFAKQGITLTRNFQVQIGLHLKKSHRFDLGLESPKMIVECKSHRWTVGARVPSAKMTVWNEAMFYFVLVPPEFRRVLFVLHDRRGGEGETLLSYYQRTYAHLIPAGVEFLEFDAASRAIVATGKAQPSGRGEPPPAIVFARPF